MATIDTPYVSTATPGHPLRHHWDKFEFTDGRTNRRCKVEISGDDLILYYRDLDGTWVVWRTMTEKDIAAVEWMINFMYGS